MWKNRNIFTQHIVTGVDYPSGLIRFRPQAHPWTVVLIPNEFNACGLKGFANETKVCFICLLEALLRF